MRYNGVNFASTGNRRLKACKKVLETLEDCQLRCIVLDLQKVEHSFARQPEFHCLGSKKTTSSDKTSSSPGGKRRRTASCEHGTEKSKHTPVLPIAEPSKKCGPKAHPALKKADCRIAADKLAEAILSKKGHHPLSDLDVLPVFEHWRFPISKRSAFGKKQSKAVEVRSENFGLVRSYDGTWMLSKATEKYIPPFREAALLPRIQESIFPAGQGRGRRRR